MEFQAYASHSQGHTASALWRIQSVLHKGESLLLPGMLLLAAVGFVVYEHFSATHAYNSNRNFLAMILVTMFPLVFLEKKILACCDPLSVMSKFSGKVLLSHASFLVLRLPQHYVHDGVFSLNFFFCFLFLAVACALLPVCCRFCSVRSFVHENWDVWSVALLGLMGAVLTEALNYYFDPRMRYRYGRARFCDDMVATGALYMELLAFVPAVWMVCRVGGANTPAQTHQEDKESDVADTKKRALALFAFLVGFYFTEDVIAAFLLGRDMPMAALGHLAHFALLLDFAFFLLAHLYDPAKVDKLMGSLRDMFAEACAV